MVFMRTVGIRKGVCAGVRSLCRRGVVCLLSALLLWACASTKKSLEVSTARVDSLGHQATRGVKVERVTDTTKSETGRLVVTEVVFFAPDSSWGSIESLSINAGSVDVAGIKGKPIRSVRQQVFESVTERRGEDKESREDKERRQAVSVQQENVTLARQASPAPDPYRWRYVFYLSLVVLAGVMYCKRVPVVDLLRRVFRWWR